MSLFEEIEKEVVSPACSLQLLMNSMDEEDRESLLKALAMDQKKMPAVAISRALRRRELVIDQATITKHRGGVCRCRGSKGI